MLGGGLSGKGLGSDDAWGIDSEADGVADQWENERAGGR
jgi:hypothetical protein